MSHSFGASSFILQSALNFIGQGRSKYRLLRWLPGAVLGEPKSSRYGTAILGFPSRPLQGEELVVNNSGGIRVEAQNNLHTRNAAVDAVVPKPGPLSSGGFEELGS